MLTPIGEILFDHLDMEVLYDPNERTAIIYYVYCRTIERGPSAVANSRFFKVTRDLEELFCEYNTSVLNKFFK